ncbi:MAG TPA: glycosyltransferase [Candidatus Acidoferrales bacterium]|nr:glycosyltransferase [Candidatus Acidoferrales bacterium]
MSRIALVTFGSLGDLHPFLAIGTELRRRGHAALLATHADYRELVTSAGLEFAPVRPEFGAPEAMEQVMKRAMDLRRGTEYVLRELVLPWTRDAAEDLLAAAPGSDLIVSHMIAMVAGPVAEKLGVPRVQVALQPSAVFSAHDPPTLPTVPGSELLRRALPPFALAALWRLLIRGSRPWFEPLDALRRDLGLPRSRRHPLLEAWSPLLNLALFSPRFAAPQRDWPARTLATGFPHDFQRESLASPLEAFLAAGEPPIVFTLGSSAVWDPRDFWRASLEAARAVGRRAVLLAGANAAALPRTREVHAIEWAPHAALFPRACAIVHSCGIGTTARALEAGRPMLGVPWSHDQPDNATRCRRLGVSRVLARGRYDARSAARELRALLADENVAVRAAEEGAAFRAERGAQAAADALERVLAAPSASGGSA